MTLSEKLIEEYKRDGFEGEPIPFTHLRKAIKDKKRMYAVVGLGVFMYHVEGSDVIIAETNPEPAIGRYTSFESPEYLKIFMNFFNEGKHMSDDEVLKSVKNVVNFTVPKDVLKVRISPEAILYFEKILESENKSFF